MGAVRGRFPIPRSRRGLLVAAAVLVVVVGGAVGGVILGTVLSRHSSSKSASGRNGPGRARFPGYQLSFKYPPAWKRRDWCWIGTSTFPLTLLTTARPAPVCQKGTIFGFGTPLPPPQRLGSDGVAAWWVASSAHGLGGAKPNAHLGGRPASITVQTQPAQSLHPPVVCAGGGPTRRLVSAVIEGASAGAGRIRAGAVVCGPDLGGGVAVVRRMLASVRFTH